MKLTAYAVISYIRKQYVYKIFPTKKEAERFRDYLRGGERNHKLREKIKVEQITYEVREIERV